MLKIGYLTLEGEVSGVVAGPSVYSMAPDTIEILDIQHRVRHEYDEQHGTPSGDRHHEPFMFVKAVDYRS
jgi:type VI secretion system Hcp family effector